MSPPHDMGPAPTPPAFTLEQRAADIVDAGMAQLRRDVGRIYTVTDRTEDRMAVLVGRFASLEEKVANQNKLLVAIAEKLGVGL